MHRSIGLFLLSLWFPSHVVAASRSDSVTIHRGADRPVHEQGPIRAEPFLAEDPSLTYVGRLTLAPGAVVPPHRHPDSVEILTILSGEGLLQLDGESVRVGPGDTIHIPAAVLHDFAVAGTRAVEAIQIYTPKGPEARFRQWPVVEGTKAPGDGG